ncbi:uncharacterized protein MELLADRAFT_85946 [Melampsora larici-populina 98AG31]|uniref:Uncharacterized protein n=1 Tax=Melampsora larici-populina (strain 98AG31 / pathotype 3-4-7) TaxID=747676 RepID=F4RK87_MELLP|nr:uncharacterized protein MELLADRAFT_85946 [Melampsora larici-populina 98AG31]EGG07225.1 hypothetical protein MELLADRAFT_85946 [Melampsora larici-populina 98AG31]
MFFSTSTAATSPSQPYFFIHLISLASQIFINITIAATSPKTIKQLLFPDLNIAYRQSRFLKSKLPVSAMKKFDVTLHQIFNPSSTQLNFPLNPLWLSQLLSSTDPLARRLFSILQPAVYLVLNHFRFFAPSNIRFPQACFSAAQQYARACYYRLFTIARIQTLLRYSRSLQAIRTSTSYRASRLAEPSDRTIQHDHKLPIGCNLSNSTLLRPFKSPSPIFIRRSCPPSDSYLRSLNDQAESRNLQPRYTHPDDYLDRPNRNRRSYLVNAFRQRIARHAKTLVVDDEDDFGPIDPSWL